VIKYARGIFYINNIVMGVYHTDKVLQKIVSEKVFSFDKKFSDVENETILMIRAYCLLDLKIVVEFETIFNVVFNYILDKSTCIYKKKIILIFDRIFNDLVSSGEK